MQNIEKELREKLQKYPNDAMNHYYLGKELMRTPLRDLRSINEIEELFKRSIELGPRLWAPKIALGELLYKIGRYKEAEIYFKDSLDKVPEKSVKEYLIKCISNNNTEICYYFENGKENDSLYVFENNVREFIRILLESNHKEDWWRKGVPKQVRAKCASRREEALDEEKESDLLLFADFYDYKMIIEDNKNIFSSYIDIKDWGKQLTIMEPIRNAIAHNRPLNEASVRVKECCIRFQKVMEKVKAKS